MVPFTIASGNMNYLGINLKTYMQNLSTENNKALKIKTQEDSLTNLIKSMP